MQTILSYIIQKRFSQINEDVATDALAYVLESSEAARCGMMKLFRGIVLDMPSLRFKTQQTAVGIRPDMWGYADSEPRVFLENKFWAGLTDNQPVSYLKQLALYTQPTILLVIAPAAREQTLWRELMRRLLDSGISTVQGSSAAGIAFAVSTSLGPTLALTSWTNVLSVLEHETVDDPATRGDLVQLRALCGAADEDAFVPVSMSQLSDQRTPAFILQLGSIVQATIEHGVNLNVVNIGGLRPQASWERIGRYLWMSGDQSVGAGAWFGVHFGLWKKHGTPLWIIFYGENFGRAQEVRELIEPWAAKNAILTTSNNSDFAIAIDFPTGEEKAGVVRALVDGIKEITAVLSPLPTKTLESAELE